MLCLKRLKLEFVITEPNAMFSEKKHWVTAAYHT